jgi:hypothetical protein
MGTQSGSEDGGKDPVDPREQHTMRLLFGVYVGIVVLGVSYFLVIGFSHH